MILMIGCLRIYIYIYRKFNGRKNTRGCETVSGGPGLKRHHKGHKTDPVKKDAQANAAEGRFKIPIF